MSNSLFPKTITSTLAQPHSGRRHSYTTYCDKDMQNAFRRSLSSIHFDFPSGRMSRSKHHSTRHNYDSGSRRATNSAQRKVEDDDMTNSKPRRASTNDISSYAESQRVPEVSRSSTILEKDGAIIQGILRAPSEFYVFLLHYLFKSTNLYRNLMGEAQSVLILKNTSQRERLQPPNAPHSPVQS